MTLTTPLQAEHQLDQLAGQFEHWRQTRPHAGARIPEPLWAQAVALAAVLSPTRVAKQIRVKVAYLHQRMAAPHAPALPIPLSGFVEVPLSPAGPARGGWAMELQRPDGARLHLHAPDATAFPLLALVQGFLEGRPCSN